MPVATMYDEKPVTVNGGAIAKECADRLALLKKQGMYEGALRTWKMGDICYSEDIGFTGVMYRISSVPELAKIKDEFETRTGCRSYYGIYNPRSAAGAMLSLLFVDKHADEWENDRHALKSGRPCAYVWNIDGGFGEMGDIGVAMAGGGLVRTW